MRADDIIRAVARPMREAPGYISIPAAAREFGVSLSRMKRVLASVPVPIARVGKQYRVDISHLILE